MKLLSLLILLVSSIPLFGGTGESPLPLLPQASGSPAFNIGSLSLNPASKIKPLFVWPDQSPYRFTERSVRSRSRTCYKMRAYYMVRESKDSDITQPDGYSTCQPATRFQVKRAIGRQLFEEGPTEPTPIPFR
ncbi:MAG: hypothetical protein ACHP8A_04125 [Terriglobales bacterium]